MSLELVHNDIYYTYAYFVEVEVCKITWPSPLGDLLLATFSGRSATDGHSATQETTQLLLLLDPALLVLVVVVVVVVVVVDVVLLWLLLFLLVFLSMLFATWIWLYVILIVVRLVWLLLMLVGFVFALFLMSFVFVWFLVLSFLCVFLKFNFCCVSLSLVLLLLLWWWRCFIFTLNHGCWGLFFYDFLVANIDCAWVLLLLSNTDAHIVTPRIHGTGIFTYIRLNLCGR